MKFVTNMVPVCSVIFALSTQAQEPPTSPNIGVNQGALLLSIDNFTPVIEFLGPREVITGYEAYVDVTGSEKQDTLVFQVSGEITARWFASNFAVTTTVTCSGIPVGISTVYGKRIERQSFPATPNIVEIRNGIDQCSQVKIELLKEGSLSRQLYTPIQQISFSLALKSHITDKDIL